MGSAVTRGDSLGMRQQGERPSLGLRTINAKVETATTTSVGLEAGREAEWLRKNAFVTDPEVSGKGALCMSPPHRPPGLSPDNSDFRGASWHMAQEFVAWLSSSRWLLHWPVPPSLTT